VILADEVYGDVAYDGAVPPLGSLAPDGPIVAFSSLSKAYLAPGWRTGWLAVGRNPRLDDLLAAMKKTRRRAALQQRARRSTRSRRRCSAIALTRWRSGRRLRERAVLTAKDAQRDPRLLVCRAQAAFYAMPKVDLPAGVTDEKFIVGLLRATGVLCVYGSGFGTKPEDGYFRVVFLASPGELSAIYADIAGFTRQFLGA
jgi:alanine-synthesizing transaminase